MKNVIRLRLGAFLAVGLAVALLGALLPGAVNAASWETEMASKGEHQNGKYYNQHYKGYNYRNYSRPTYDHQYNNRYKKSYKAPKTYSYRQDHSYNDYSYKKDYSYRDKDDYGYKKVYGDKYDYNGKNSYCAHRYHVKRGDTLTRISMRYGVSVYALAHANNLGSPHRIYAGQTLCIP